MGDGGVVSLKKSVGNLSPLPSTQHNIGRHQEDTYQASLVVSGSDILRRHEVLLHVLINGHSSTVVSRCFSDSVS